jgi:hypothetical protein
MKSHLTALLSAVILSAAQAAPVSVQRITAPIWPDNGQVQILGFGTVNAATAKWLAFGVPADAMGKGAVQLHDAVTGKFLRKLVDTNSLNGDGLGSSVAVTGDYVVAGAPGASLVYVFDAKTGKQLRTLSSATMGMVLGKRVSADGNFCVVGDPNYSGEAGRIEVFNLATGASVSSSVSQVGSQFGHSISMSSKLILVGAPLHDVAGDPVADGGAAFIIDRDTGDTLKVLTDSFSNGGYFGYSVALEGTRALIGAPLANASAGKASLWDARTGYQLAYCTPPSYLQSASDQFGEVVALHDGFAMVGTPSAVGYAPTVLVYNSRNSEFVRELKLNDQQSGDKWGTSLCATANALIIGQSAADTTRQFATVYRNLPMPAPGLVIAGVGGTAPGIPGATYKAFTSATIGFGSINLEATINPGNGTPKGCTKGLWSGLSSSNYFPALVLRNGSEGNGNSLTDITSFGTNSFNYGFFLAKLSGPNWPATSNQQVRVFNNMSNFNAQVLGATVSTAMGAGAEIGSFLGVAQTQRSTHEGAALLCTLRVGKGSITAASDTIVQRYDAAAQTTAYAQQEGTTVSGKVLGQLDRITYNDRTISTHTTLTAGGGGAVVNTDTTMGISAILAKKGDSFNGFTIVSILSETNATGDVSAFRATVTNPMEPTVKEVVFSDRSGSITPEIGVGRQLGPIVPGAKVAKVLGYWTEGTTMLVNTTLSGTGVTAANDGCLILRPEGMGSNDTVLMREGDQAPGVDAKIGSILRVDYDNALGYYAVLASLVGAPKGMDQALFFGCVRDPIQFGQMHETPPDRRLRTPNLILQKGTLLRDALYGDAVVKSITLSGKSTDAGAAGGRTRGAISGDEVLVIVTFADGTTRVLNLFESTAI